MALLFFITKEPYTAWINDIPYVSPKKTKNPAAYRMNLFQFGSVVLGGLLLIIAPYFASPAYVGESVFYIIVELLAFSLLFFSVIIFLVFVIKFADDRKKLGFYGLRNILLIPCIALCASAHTISYVCYDVSIANPNYKKYDNWDYSTFLLGAVLFVLILLIFKVIETYSNINSN